MAIVHFSSELAQYTEGLETLDIEAPRVLELILALTARFPALGERLGDLAIAIDGEIYQSAPYQKLQPGSEIYFIPRVAGGCEVRSVRL
jgi:molybdopterin converting factor small subunit